MTYFVTSDIHSYGQILIDSLAAAGFDINNKEHILIICGDIFDRGDDTLVTYHFIKSLPESRCILVTGNHEYLYKALLQKSFPESHDFHNGTVKTFCDIACEDIQILDKYYIATKLFDDKNLSWTKVENELMKNWRRICKKVSKSPVTEFICDKARWKNYYELNNYVFVHSFVPTVVKPEYASAFASIGLSASNVGTDLVTYNKDWRNSEAVAWESATWGCPWSQFKAGLFKENKTLVVGHWHTSDFFDHLTDSPHGITNCEIYNKDGLIGLDACVALNKRLNILVIKDES